MSPFAEACPSCAVPVAQPSRPKSPGPYRAATAPPRPRKSPPRRLAPPRDAAPESVELDDGQRRIGRRRLAVMAAGLATSVAAMLVFGDAHGALSTYTLGIVPMGAVGIGALAGSGFGASAWFLTGLRFTWGMLFGVVVTMVGCFVWMAVAEYLDYAPAGMGFFTYIHEAAGDAALEVVNRYGHVVATRELSRAAGYNYRALECAGLVAGGLLGCWFPELVRRRLGL